MFKISKECLFIVTLFYALHIQFIHESDLEIYLEKIMP